MSYLYRIMLLGETDLEYLAHGSVKIVSHDRCPSLETYVLPSLCPQIASYDLTKPF
jgi:hypothetical protein